MTRNEYQALVEFLARRFDKSDRSSDERFSALENRLTRVELGNEQNAHQIQILAEGIGGVDQKLERFRGEVTEEFRAVRSEMAEGFGAVRGEMAEGFSEVRQEMTDGFLAVRQEMADGFDSQGNLIQNLGVRVDRWEGRSA